MPLTKRELLHIYDDVGNFSGDGLAWAAKNGEEFHIHPDGTPAYEQRYDWAGPFQDGEAAVMTGQEVFLINPKGERIAN